MVVLTSCTTQGHFLERSLVSGGETRHYRVWLPKDYNRLRRWPVILFLHGSGERGDDNLRQLTIGLPAVLDDFADRYRFVVVIPQCPLDREWYGDEETKVLAALDAAMTEFRGDPRRVILTGISMGGAGTWYMGRHRDRFAALVPVCGEVVRQRDDPFPQPPPDDLARILAAPEPYKRMAAAIVPTPVWAFHGQSDPVIPARETRSMVAALSALRDPVIHTEYPGVGHNAWDSAYAEPALPEWMLQQRLVK